MIKTQCPGTLPNFATTRRLRCAIRASARTVDTERFYAAVGRVEPDLYRDVPIGRVPPWMQGRFTPAWTAGVKANRLRSDTLVEVADELLEKG